MFVSPFDQSVDPQQILREIELAHAYWLGRGEEIPLASLQIAALCRRVIVAEAPSAAQTPGSQTLARSACRPLPAACNS